MSDLFPGKLTKNPLDRVILIGMMGSGKSTIGRQLAQKLHWGYVDTDTMLEERFGYSIAQLFAYYGEREFRKLESSILYSLQQRQHIVIATGGGLACHHDHMDLLLAMGLVIYLEVPVDILAHRIINTARPIIKHKSSQQIIESLKYLLSEREVYYLKSHLMINASQSEGQILDEIWEVVEALVQANSE